MERSEVWICRLRPPTGSEPGYTRPVVVIQSDDISRRRIASVVVVVLTGNLNRADSPGNVYLAPEDSGLQEGSVVNVTQVVTVDRRQLVQQVGRLSPEVMAIVDDGLRYSLGL